METVIEDKVVIITGAADGIGYAIAEAFLKENPKVIAILDINEAKGVEATNHLNSKYGLRKTFFFKCDVTEDLDRVFDAIIAKFETIDILVNNAGLCDENSIRKTIALNTVATVEWTMRFWDYARKDRGGKGGTVLNLSSVYGYIADPFLPFYKTSKFAVIGFTRTMGHKLNYNQSGVRVVVLCPGFTKTSISSGFPDNLKYQVPEYSVFKSKMPLQDAEAVGKAAVDMFKKAKSGSAWTVSGAQPVEEVPYKYPPLLDC